MSALTEPNPTVSTPTPNKQNPILRLLFVAYVTTAQASLIIVLAINWYARSYDPWLTPRHTHYMRIYWALREIFMPIGALGFLAGLAIVLSPLKWKQRKYVWMSLGLFSLVVYLS